MKLVIGGAGQGKLAYVLERTGLGPEDVTYTLGTPKPIVCGLSGIVRRALDRDRDPVAEVLAYAGLHPDTVFLCDEVGCGVVPVEPAQRAHREAVGRLCCRLAERAERVERIFCGLPMVLKGEGPWN